MEQEPESDADRLIGEVIASRYRIEERIGTGAMGTVYRARHVKLGRPFAIKVLRPTLLDDLTVRRRFSREAELAGALHHPSIVSMVDVGETPGGLHYLVMEYAEGETLYDVMLREAPMPGARVMAIVRQLCEGLQHAHDRGLIHRDFKPENVIVEPGAGRDQVKIVDFGIAILRDEAMSSSPERLTTVGIVLGTPHYMAPEQALGQAIDHRVDLFALGVMCFEMLTAWPPFDGDGVDVARANVTAATPVMADRAPGRAVDPLLEGFTRRLMMKSRDDRPATAAAASALIDLIERDPAAAATALGDAMPPVRPRAAASRSPAVTPAQPTPTLRGQIAPSSSSLRGPATTPLEASRTLRTPAAPPPTAAIAARPSAGQLAPTAPVAPLVHAPFAIEARPALVAPPILPAGTLGIAPGALDHCLAIPAVPSRPPRPNGLRAETTEQLPQTPPGRIRLAITGIAVAAVAAILVVVAIAVAVRLHH